MVIKQTGMLCGYGSYGERIESYIQSARLASADNALAVTPDEIVFDPRTVIKCMFGCGDWGKGLTCPSANGFLKLDEWEKLLRMYKTVLIIHSTSKKIAQTISFSIEKQAYLDGDVLSFSMSDCALCGKCAGFLGESCRNPLQARPAFHSVGIDVFATTEKLGLPLKPLKNEGDAENWYSAVWLN